MNGIFDEHRMIQVLETCIPNGETLTAGIHGVTLQVNKKNIKIWCIYWYHKRLFDSIWMWRTQVFKWVLSRARLKKDRGRRYWRLFSAGRYSKLWDKKRYYGSRQLFDHVEERRFSQAPVSKTRRFRQRNAAPYRISGKDYREVDCFKRESLDSYQASHNQPLHKSKPRVERVVCTSLYVFHDNILLLPWCGRQTLIYFSKRRISCILRFLFLPA